MSRTKSSRIAHLRDLLNSATAELDAIQTEQEDLMQDSARLKEIEPALNRLQSALKPPDKLLAEQSAVSILPPEPLTEPPVEPPTEPVKHHRVKKGTPADESASQTE
jgi:hypothetical protein